MRSEVWCGGGCQRKACAKWGVRGNPPVRLLFRPLLPSMKWVHHVSLRRLPAGMLRRLFR